MMTTMSKSSLRLNTIYHSNQDTYLKKVTVAKSKNLKTGHLPQYIMNTESASIRSISVEEALDILTSDICGLERTITASKFRMSGLIPYDSTDSNHTTLENYFKACERLRAKPFSQMEFKDGPNGIMPNTESRIPFTHAGIASDITSKITTMALENPFYDTIKVSITRPETLEKFKGVFLPNLLAPRNSRPRYVLISAQMGLYDPTQSPTGNLPCCQINLDRIIQQGCNAEYRMTMQQHATPTQATQKRVDKWIDTLRDAA